MGTWSPQNRYDAAGGKNATARPTAFIRRDASAGLSCPLSDCTSTLENDADGAPGVPAGRQRLGHATTLHTGLLLPSFKPHAPIL